MSDLTSNEIKEKMSSNTCMARVEGWARNIVCNEFTIRNGRGINELFGLCNPDNLPVILVGAGPSLDKNIEELKKCQGHAFIIACDAVHKVLTKAKIKPDMVFVLDTQAIITTYLDYEESKDVILCMHSIGFPAVHEYWQGEVYWYNSYPTDASPLTGALMEFTGQIGAIAGCGTVITMMFSLAMLFSSNLIIFVGCDAAYYESNKQHAIGSLAPDFVYQEDETCDVYGQKCFTNIALSVPAEWIESAFCRTIEGQIFINATEGGIISNGCLVMSLEQARKKFLTKKFDIPKIISRHEIPEDARPEKRWKFKESEKPIPQPSTTYFPADFLLALTEKVKEVNQ